MGDLDVLSGRKLYLASVYRVTLSNSQLDLFLLHALLYLRGLLRPINPLLHLEVRILRQVFQMRSYSHKDITSALGDNSVVGNILDDLLVGDGIGLEVGVGPAAVDFRGRSGSEWGITWVAGWT